jgi:hypothetical protein
VNTQTITGEFPRGDWGSSFISFDTAVIYDDIMQGAAGRSHGATRVARVDLQPTLMQHWRILGWSISAKLGLAISPALPVTAGIWGTLGELWAGLASGANLADSGGMPHGIAFGTVPKTQVAFPPDMSTFAKIWDGAEERITLISNALSGLEADARAVQVGLTYMLPSPIEHTTGSQVQMVLALTKSVIGTISGPCSVLVRSATYTLIYDEVT